MKKDRNATIENEYILHEKRKRKIKNKNKF